MAFLDKAGLQKLWSKIVANFATKAELANIDVQDEIYIGSGEMPEGYVFQINPEGEVISGSGSTEGAILYTAQTLTEAQKTQARVNIGAVSENEIFKEVTSTTTNMTCHIGRDPSQLDSFTETWWDEYSEELCYEKTFYKIGEMDQKFYDSIIIPLLQQTTITTEYRYYDDDSILETEIEVVVQINSVEEEEGYIGIMISDDIMMTYYKLLFVKEELKDDYYTIPPGIWIMEYAFPGPDYSSVYIDTMRLNNIPIRGPVKVITANSFNQMPEISLVRNSKIIATEDTPSVNGEIYWIYE